MMNNLRMVALLAVAVGFFAYRGTQMPIYAASSDRPSMGTQEAGKTPGDHAANAVGAQAYESHCSVCHGENRQGNLPAFPPLVGIERRMTDKQITDLVHTGRGRMPGFPKLPQDEFTALLHYLASSDIAPSAAAGSSGSPSTHSSSLASAGGQLFQQNCAFCHGRDAAGGETGPDLTRSKLVSADVSGDKISEVVRNGRPEKKMPAFNFSTQEMLSLVAFIHDQEAKAIAHKGSRRGVDVSDLQTGSVETGKQYFNGAGGCATCHSPTGDLAGIAARYQGLQLEERMLYPRDVKSRVTLTLPSGESVTGTVAYLDEFTVGLLDGSGKYRSWAINKVKYKLDSPVNAHVDLFSKYTDADIHNLMAYLQTMR